MRTTMNVVSISLVVLACAGGMARAEGADLGVGVGFLPGGDASVKYQGESASASLLTGFAVGADLGFEPRPGVRLAVAGQYQTGLETDNDNGDNISGRLLSGGLRIEGLKQVAPGVRMYVYGMPAYSRLLIRDEGSGMTEGANGFGLGGGAGSRFDVNPSLTAFVELGYQWATHRLVIDGPDPRYDVMFFQLRAGMSLKL